MERGAVMMPNPIKQRYELIAGHLNEHQRRLWAGAEARVLGWGYRPSIAGNGLVAWGRRCGPPGTEPA